MEEERTHLDERRRPSRASGRFVAGAILILVGLGLLGLQLTQGAGETLFLLFLGGVFLAGYFYRRAYGLLIPAGILLGLGVGSVIQAAFPRLEGLNSLGLGLGFLSIFALDWVMTRQERWWPMIPGGILVLVGLADLNEGLASLLRIGWPFILILVGLFLLLSTRRNPR